LNDFYQFNKNKNRTCLDVGMSPLFLLFDCNEAELQARFRKLDLAKQGVSFADGSGSGGSAGTLISRGAAFDFSIAAAADPHATYHIFSTSDLSAIRSSLSLGLGSAVASGQHVPALIKAMMLLGEILGSALNAAATYWKPASVVAGFGYYSESVSQYDNGAAFPALVSVGFDTTTDDSIRTTGLGWLSGQDLIFERDGLPISEAMRYVVRLVHDIATNGAIERIMDVPGMNDFESLSLVPDDSEGAVIVRRKHVQNGVNSAG
jgi:hypothetical protein